MIPSFVTRFAPSPTGHLHKGHAFAALMAYRAALHAYGRFILRIEDIDTVRCKPDFIDDMLEDLTWLGLRWEQPVLLQSSRFDAYSEALARLHDMAVIYPCFCTRSEIMQEINSAPSAPHGPDGPLYPGTCQTLHAKEAEKRIANDEPHAWRLDHKKALQRVGRSLFWHDEHRGQQRARPEIFGDVVLARKDTPTSYHLAVTVDDAFQGITHIVRGEDLFQATHVHCLLQGLLSLPTPTYAHHALLCDEMGERLAKRRGSESLKSLRTKGMTAQELIKNLPLHDKKH